MTLYIFVLASLAFAAVVTAAIFFLLWNTRREERAAQELKAYAEALPGDERPRQLSESPTPVRKKKPGRSRAN